jgi:hypothetical protein
MKRLLIAGVAAISLSTSTARADLPVVDFTAVGKLLESIGIEEIVQVYTMVTNVWNSVAEVVGTDQWAPGLNDPGQRNPLPFAAADHPGWVGGYNDPSGIPFGGQYLSQNTVGGDLSVYKGGDFVGSELLRGIQSVSSMQAVASNHVQSIETRLIGIVDLFSHLSGIATIQETDSLSARLHTELNIAQSQQVQAQQVMAAAQLQRDARENNQHQWLYQDEINGIVAACGSAASAASFITIPACAAGK